jgi:hypothetical protein
MPGALTAEIVAVLRGAGARFGLLHGRVLFDDDPPARVRWTAITRKLYADEQPRLRHSHHEFAEAVRRGR